eukprot:6475534-Amphidinium_carterae.1
MAKCPCLVGKQYFQQQTLAEDDIGMLQVWLAKFPDACGFAGAETAASHSLLMAGINLQKKYKEVKPNPETTLESISEAGVSTEKLHALRHSWVQVETCFKPFQELAEPGIKVLSLGSAIKAVQEQANELVKHIYGALKAGALAEFQLALKALMSVAGGVKGGSEWQEKLPKSTSWKALQEKFKEKLLFDVNPVQLVDATQTLAKEKVVKTLDLMAEHLPPDEEKNVVALLQQARVTKCTGCLLDSLTTLKGQELWKAVNNELKELRNYAGKGKEAELLHPLVWKHAESALKGKTVS